jgi:hypothetical protein
VSLIDRLTGKTLCVSLTPQALSCVVRKGNRFTAEGAYRQSVSHSDGTWQPVLSLFQEYLQCTDRPRRHLPISFVLSNCWSRMMMIPWSDALLKETNASAFLQSQYVALYGDEARDWVITADDAPYGQPRLACAIERSLIEAIQRLAQEHRFSCQSVEPILSAAWRATAGSAAHQAKAFAVVEAGWISMAATSRGRINGIQSQPCRHNWPDELPRIWQRWILRSPELADIAQVALLNLTDETIKDELPNPFVSVSLPLHGLDSDYRFVSCARH